jgi:hypothetical protein
VVDPCNGCRRQIRDPAREAACSATDIKDAVSGLYLPTLKQDRHPEGEVLLRKPCIEVLGRELRRIEGGRIMHRTKGIPTPTAPQLC